MTIRLLRHPIEACQSQSPALETLESAFSLSVSIIAAGRNVRRLTMAGAVAFLVENEWWLSNGGRFERLGYILPTRETCKANPRVSYISLTELESGREIGISLRSEIMLEREIWILCTLCRKLNICYIWLTT